MNIEILYIWSKSTLNSLQNDIRHDNISYKLYRLLPLEKIAAFLSF